jgi:hypothetical protein
VIPSFGEATAAARRIQAWISEGEWPAGASADASRLAAFVLAGDTERLPNALEAELRREWWLNHGHDHFALYGDDGEMACNACPADFQRDPLDRLRTLVFAARAARAE